MAINILKNKKTYGVKQINPERWLDDFGGYLFSYAMSQLNNEMHAEDVVQETLISAYESYGSYAGKSTEKTWLTGILKLKIIDLIRKQVREPTIDNISENYTDESESWIDELFDQRGSWIRPPQDWASPDKMLQNHQFITSYERCFKNLKPVLANIYNLKEESKHSSNEICTLLGITLTNLNVIFYRARMTLRRCLENQWPELKNEGNS